MREQLVEQRLEVRFECVGSAPAVPVARVRVQDREVDLVLIGIEIEEQLLHLVHDLGDARIGPVDLVHDEHDRQARLQGLAEHEARLWQRALGGVDQQQHAVDHRERTLHLAAEIRVTRAYRRC